jgi:hypothetical protein
MSVPFFLIPAVDQIHDPLDHGFFFRRIALSNHQMRSWVPRLELTR